MVNTHWLTDDRQLHQQLCSIAVALRYVLIGVHVCGKGIF